MAGFRKWKSTDATRLDNENVDFETILANPAADISGRKALTARDLGIAKSEEPIETGTSTPEPNR